MKGVDYSQDSTPPEYVCGECKASGVKLWREYQAFEPKVFCAKCAMADQGASGMNRHEQIGNLVPAVPDEEGVGYWGYTSVPQPGVEWWRRLPMSL